MESSMPEPDSGPPPASPGAESSAATPPAAAPRRAWWWRVIGIRRRQGRRLRWLAIVPTRWGWFLLFVFAAFGGMIAFAEYSMQPAFCRSCHLMEPYYKAWHESSHRDVPCGDCHFDPGWRNTLKGKWQASSQAVKYITNTYGSKPHAEVHDEACLREGCHERRLLEGKVNWDVPTQRGTKITIRFDHTPHLAEARRGKSLRCVSCHSQIVQGQHIVVTLDTCFLCHFKGVKHGREDQTLGGCKSCHDQPRSQIRLARGVFNHSEYTQRGAVCQDCHSDAIAGDGAVPRQICWNCHNQPHQIARYGETAFVHKTHVSDHKVECSSCHVQIVHSLKAAHGPQGDSPDTSAALTIRNSGSCGTCHAGSHNGPLDLYRGTGGRGVPDLPSDMYLTQVDCIACHRQPEKGQATAMFAGQTYVADQTACKLCHDKQYVDLLPQWKAVIALKLSQAEAAAKRAEVALTAEGPALVPLELLRRQRLMDDAAHNIRFVKSGGGIHNVTYATALLNYAIDICRQVAGEVVPATAPVTDVLPVPTTAPAGALPAAPRLDRP